MLHFSAKGKFHQSAIYKAYRDKQVIYRLPVKKGYPLKTGQIKVKPFVVSLSNHERLNRPPFDKLRANG